MGLGVLKQASAKNGISRMAGTATVFGILGMVFLAGLLLPAGVALAQEESGNEETSQEEEIQEIYPFICEEWTGRSEDILELAEAEREYQVLPGDCLWNISGKLWGDGKWYGMLTAAGGETLKDPNLIYPGMTLLAARRGYICRRQAGNRGMQMGEYSMDMPGNWTVGTISSGDASANLVLSGEGFEKILCLVQDRRDETALTTADWQVCAERIRDYAEQYYGENVSDLTFEHYRMGQGEEVYLYSFLWQMEYLERKAGVRVCMGLKLTEHIQAEFLGFASRYDIHGGVRYTTASFEEQAEDYDPETFTVNDSNMAILPGAQWELEGLYDPFMWLDEFFTTLIERAAGTEPEPENVREKLSDRISRPGGRR